MAIDFNTTGDQNVADGLETVTLRSPGQGVSITIPGALRRSARTRESAPSAGRVTETDVIWRLPTAAVPAAPVLGAAIIDAAGAVWTILEVEQATLAGSWRCLARRLDVAAGLDQRITIERATWSKSTSGAPIAAWSVVRSGVLARIQPQEAHIEREHDRRQRRITHKIHLAEPFEVDADMRVRQGNNTYHIVGYESPERIDQLFVILAEQTPWPLAS